MCLGVPARIEAIVDPEHHLLRVSLSGIERDVNGSCVWDDTQPQALIGQWVLVHVGFAMALLSEQEAQQTLTLLTQMGMAQQELTDFSRLGMAANTAGAQ